MAMIVRPVAEVLTAAPALQPAQLVEHDWSIAAITHTYFYQYRPSVPEVAEEKAKVLSTAIMLVDGSPTLSEKMGAFFSALSMVFPGARDLFRTSLRNAGYTITDVYLPSEAPAYGIVMMNPMPAGVVAVSIGQLLLVPFKDISGASYGPFIDARIDAMCSFAQIVNDGALKVVNLESAEYIRRFCTHELVVKTALLTAINSNASLSPSPFTSVCNYLRHILEYTEMSAIVFIYDTLIMPRSPVLSDPMVAPEVINLYRAFIAISSCPIPAFFRIMSHYSLARLVERNRFPTLFAVAVRLKSETQLQGLSLQD